MKPDPFPQFYLNISAIFKVHLFPGVSDSYHIGIEDFIKLIVFMGYSLHNRRYLKFYRKQLRNNATKAETHLWKALKKRQLEGRKFRRQHSIGNYIVDFYCPSEKLIIEVDGQIHYNPVNEAYDEKRSDYLRAEGFKIVRFENKTVFENLEMVLESIRQQFQASPPGKPPRP